MRVITGTARGRRLLEPEGMDTRPTTDRVKEGIFSSIQFEIEGRRVLDLFGGTGQMGIEEITERSGNLIVDARRLPMEAVMALAAAHRGKILFSAGSKPYLTVRPEKGKNGLETAQWALEQIGQALEQAAKEHPQQEMQAQEKQTAVQKPQE